MSKITSLHEVEPTKHEEIDGINPLTVVARSIVDSAYGSSRHNYRRSVLPHLNLLTRSGTAYNVARKLILPNDDNDDNELFFVSRTGPEVTGVIVLSGIHKVFKHETSKLRGPKKLIDSGVIVECWNTVDCEVSLSELYAEGVRHAKSQFTDETVLTIERVPNANESTSIFKHRRNAFDLRIIDAIQDSFEPIDTGLITREDMRSMIPVNCTVFVAT